MSLQQADNSAWKEVLKLLGHRITEKEASEPYCRNCLDLGHYEVFKFKDLPGEIIGYQNVRRIMAEKGFDNWREMEHVSYAHRCVPCYDRFQAKHSKLVKELSDTDDKTEQGEIKRQLKVLWGRA